MRDSRAATFIGLDVGSTTVKAVVVGEDEKTILWSDYQRHHTQQAACALEFLARIEREITFGEPPPYLLLTGSGAGPLLAPLGAKSVQEVNAVAIAAQQLYPNVGSVVELGGQDAKVIIFKRTDGGKTQVITSMNDKCASGTGATIDKCLVKVGVRQDALQDIHFDESKLHHVAAKCGVFAETDIVNLVKSGIPANEILCSLADAIVMQNLSVLTRGNTLRDTVLLLGGPNTYLPFLRECFRLRIPQTWRERGWQTPESAALDSLICVPDDAQYYAAYGAALYGAKERAGLTPYAGCRALREFVERGRGAQLKKTSGPPLSQGAAERAAFEAQYTIPTFRPATFPPGAQVDAVVGLDGGSTSSKAVLVSQNREVLAKAYTLSKGNPLEDMKVLLAQLQQTVHAQGARLNVLGFGATGYAADILEKTLSLDVNLVETVAHAKSALHFFPDVDVVCDIGGQDIKVLFLSAGQIHNFRLSNQCSAGNGMLLQAMADQFDIPVQEYAEHAFRAEITPKFSYGCAVFLDSDRVNFQKEGYQKDELLAGLAQVLPKNVWQYVVQVPRMAELGRRFVLQGGTQYNLAALKAQVDYILARVPDAEVFVHPFAGEAGALGAAFEALDVVNKRGRSTFVGMEQAIGLGYKTTNDETTRCNFCPNLCSRTFIDARTPNGGETRYISGFSCEKGTVEDLDALKVIHRSRQERKKAHPNLVDYEAHYAFKRFYTPSPMPQASPPPQRQRWLARLRGNEGRTFKRSSSSARQRRADIRVGVPRVLNIYNIAPFARTYFEALGVPSHNIRFSDFTSEDMWLEGGKYGSVDNCYPSKVAQAHIHNLLNHHHSEQEPLSFIFFPCITHVPAAVTSTMDEASCPIVAGTPEVIRAAFTKEVDFFERAGVDYLSPALTFVEHNLLKKRMFEAFRHNLEITQDENDHAVDQGILALKAYDDEMERLGQEILERAEKENTVVLLMIGRPYHSDPGLNHAILEEFQALGFPILSMRSLPKDPVWLNRFFAEDLRSGRVDSPLDIRDVWPENYSTNSAQKVWAAKFASRHPNVAVLDLSSFKCGHDAPTYGIIDSIVKSAGTPFAQLHDIDANKPVGSLKIRVKTYSHTLEKHANHLREIAANNVELKMRIEEKRVELLRRSIAESVRRGTSTATLDRQLHEAETNARGYREAFERTPTPPEPDPTLIQIGATRSRGAAA